MQYLIILCFLSVGVMGIQTTTATHWMVTETGFIQPKLDSPFLMRIPHDLLAFLNQDTRWNNIINLYHDLSKRQSILDKQWAEIEKGDYVKVTDDYYCLKIGILNTLNWYYAELEDGSSKYIPDEEYLLNVPTLDEDNLVPDCKKISSLINSKVAFEHLNGTSGRVNLTIEAEQELPRRISSLMSIGKFGRWLATVLRKNSTSWLHYNMASLYWRVKGHGHKAMECSRRAVHYAPEYYRDIALLNMGMILHRSKRTEDAITVLSAALELDPNYYLTHFILANALAVYGDYNKSLEHYDTTLYLMPEFRLAEKYRDEMLCCASLLKSIVSARATLEELRKNVKEYLRREAYWVKAQAAFFKAMRLETEYDYRDVERNCEKMTELTGLNIKGLKTEGEKYALIHYFVESPMFNNRWMTENGVHTLESAFSLHKIVKQIQKNANKKPEFIFSQEDLKIIDGTIIDEIGPMPMVGVELVVENDDKKDPTPKDKQESNPMSEFETGIVLYPQTMKVNRNREDFDKDPEWPSVKFCKDYASINIDKVEGIYPMFLPFENKGVRLRFILSDRIGIPLTREHDLPWHPPYCNSKDGTPPANPKKSPKMPLLNDVIPTDYLNKKLLEYVGDGDIELAEGMQEAEIGQRIFSAMQKNVAPQWILYTLSSLYWRVRGNNNNALSCLLQGIKVVNSQYRDLVLASLASVYLEMGHFDDSLSAAEEAFKLNMYEPVTNLILAELNMIKKQRSTQLFHLKQVVRIEPHFMDGLARNLLYSWACIQDFTRQASVMKEFALIEKDSCSGDKDMPCNSENGDVNCKSNDFQCFSGRDKGMGSVVDEIEKKTDYEDDLIDNNMFASIINNMPTQRTDRGGHEMNYEDLLKIAHYDMMGCGTEGCRNFFNLGMTTGDLALKRQDCQMQFMQFGYWLHVVGFRHILEDPNLRIPAEVESVTPNNAKKVPECRLFTEPSTDFFLERMMRVDTDGWAPELRLMHQYTEIYGNSDYVILGAKLAKYISEHPQSWRALLSAGWWCGAGGRGACAVRCFAAAFSLAPKHLSVFAPRSLAALLNAQSKLKDAKDMAYLSFYIAPKSKLGAFVAGITHSFLNEYDQAVWMYRYTLKFDPQYLPAKACLHATMCHMIYPELSKDQV